jgi:hypothetical protein
MIIGWRADGNPGRGVKDFHELKVWQKAHQLAGGLSDHGNLPTRRTLRASHWVEEIQIGKAKDFLY